MLSSTTKLQLKYFGGCNTNASDGLRSVDTTNKQTMKYGYIVNPVICNQAVIDWCEEQSFNPNATFYKTWTDITSKNRWELFIDQILHYASTYGTSYQGEPYIPNSEPESIDFTQFKLIKFYSYQEIAVKCYAMFNGIALKEETVKDLIEILKSVVQSIDMTKIKNKEARLRIFAETGTIPTDCDEFMRYLIFKASNKTLLIKDNATITNLKMYSGNISTSMLTDFGVEKLATCFNRHKRLFLALKTNRNLLPIVNRIAKLSKKLHVPAKKGYWEQILSKPELLKDIDSQLPFLNNFKKVALMNECSMRMSTNTVGAYVIRNQKLWVKDNSKAVRLDEKYYMKVYTKLYESLIESLSKKACKVRLNPNIDLVLPTSQKSFIGHLPIGSNINLRDFDEFGMRVENVNNLVVGVHWKGVDGARDLDLSSTNINGFKTGWNASYNNKGFTFSGDMTSANPEATELLYCKNGCPDTSFSVNLYSGDDNSKFTLFIAKENIANLNRNYMVSPDNIIFSTQLEMTSKQIGLGCIVNGKYVFANLRTGNNTISSGRTGVNDTDYIKYQIESSLRTLDLRNVLWDAGFTFSTDVNEKVDIDLTIPDQSMLIELLNEVNDNN